MGALAFWLQWENVFFLAPLFLAVFGMLLVALGSLGGHEVGHGHDVGHDVGGHDLSGHDVGHDFGHDHNIGHDHDMGHDHEGSGAVSSFFAFLGLGRAPLSLLVVVAFIFFGGVGIALNCLLGTGFFVLNLALAFLSMIFGSSYAARGFARVIPNVESYAVPMSALSGNQGSVLNTITQDSGLVRVYDEFRNMREVPARTMLGAPKVEVGSVVYLINFDETKQVWYVQTWEALRQSRSEKGNS